MPPSSSFPGNLPMSSTHGVGQGGKTLHGLVGLQTHKRHRKILKDNIRAITRPDIRRLARRGGVKRISATIYEDTREALQTRLRLILKDCIQLVEMKNTKTVTVPDIIFTLRRLGTPVYGFDHLPYKKNDQLIINGR